MMDFCRSLLVLGLMPLLFVPSSMGAGFKTLEEARYALKMALLDASKQCVKRDSYLFSAKGYPEVIAFVIKNQDGTYGISDVIKGSDKQVQFNFPTNAVESMHTHPFFVDSPLHIFSRSRSDLGPSGQDIATAISSGIPFLVLDCATGDIYGALPDGRAMKYTCDENAASCIASDEVLAKHRVTSIVGQSFTMQYSQQEADSRLNDWAKEHPTGEMVNKVPVQEGPKSRHPTQWPPYPSRDPSPHYPHHNPKPRQDEDHQDILDSIEELGETFEYIVDERRDMRDERRKRKEEKRRKEQERKQLEAERLRQQQLEEQRKKKDSQKKTSEKKSDKKQDVKKDVKKTEPPKDSPTPAPATADIDFSKLNSLISQQVSFLRGIISSGQKATSALHSQFNSLNNQYVSEFNRLKAQIGNISDPTIRNQYYSQLASINSRMSSEVDPLLAQGQSRGLFKNL